MTVIILGAGVIGVTTAYYLARAGMQVTVIDRQPAPAMETSHANAGQVSPGYSTPWAAPGIPLKAMRWLLQSQHAPLAIRPDGTLFQWRWIAQMLRNCTGERYALNKERMMRLAEYSRSSLQSLRQDTRLQYEQRMGGTLQLFRSDAQWDAAARDMAVLKQCGVPHELLDRADLTRVEPGLQHAASPLRGGLWLPQDETGDCHLFTQGLARQCAAMGVTFQWGRQIDALLSESGRITGVRCGGEVLQADRYVMALGSYSRGLLSGLKLGLPVYPVKGYSLTVPLLDASRAPLSTVLDETYKIALTRFDNRIRVGGMAELAGFDLRLNPKRRATLEMVCRDLFPGGDLPQASFWTGLRPMTPDGTPIVGPSPWPNLFLNTGHGTLGWTMACGSGRLLADLMSGRPADIRADDLSLSRYGAQGTRASAVRAAAGASVVRA